MLSADLLETHSTREWQAYCLTHAPDSLHKSRLDDRLEKFLSDIVALRARVRLLGPGRVAADYDFLPPDAPLRQVQEALRLSYQVLVRDPSQLDGQLLGRLLGDGATSPQLDHLLSAARHSGARPRLLPRTGSLTPPGRALAENLDARGILALAVSPDGLCAVAGARGGSIRVWDVESGKLRHSIAAHGDRVRAVAVFSGGRKAVSASDDGMLAVLDLNEGKIERVLTAHGGAIATVAATIYGETAVAGMADGAVEVWDLAAGTLVRELRGLSTRVLALAIDATGRRVVAGAEDSSMRSWDLETGAVLALAGHAGPIAAVAVSRDGCRALSGARDQTLRIWNLDTGAAVSVLREPSINCLAILAEGRHAVRGSDAGITLWDIEDGSEIATLPGVGCDFLCPLPGGWKVLAANPLRVWDLDRAGSAAPWSLEPGTVTVTEDGSIALRGGSRGEIEIWDLARCELLRTLRLHEKRIRAAAVTPDGRLAITGAHDGTLRLWDLESGSVVRELPPHPGGVIRIDVVQEGRRMVTASGHAELRGWSLPDGDEIAGWSLPGHLAACAMTPDGRHAVVGLYLEGEEEPNRVWDLKAGRQLHVLRGHAEAIDAVVITPDGRRAVTGSVDETLRVWEIASGRELLRVDAPDHQVRGLAVSRDLRLVASAADDATVRLWELDTGKLLATFTCESHVSSVAFTPDGRTLVAAGINGALHCLDVLLGP